MSWRDDVRADRAAAAEQRRADQIAAAEQRRADMAAAAEQRRADMAAAAERRQAAQEADEQARARRAQERAQARARAASWCSAHVVDLLFVPVIVIPAVLAWTAMASYGHSLYGAPGWLLPAFSEGAMWAFAAATTITRRRWPERPVAMLQAGTWVFAAVAAAMNFVHGVSAPAGEGGGLAAGVVMAMVSIAGVLAHQIITTGRRRTREERAAAKIARAAARREHLVRRLAVRQAVAELAADGSARLIYRPGLVTVTRSRLGRRQLVDAVVPGLVPDRNQTGDRLGDQLAHEIGNYLSELPQNPSGTAETVEPGTTDLATFRRDGKTTDRRAAARLQRYVDRARVAIEEGLLPARPSRRELQRYLRCRAETAIEVARALADDDGDESAVAGRTA